MKYMSLFSGIGGFEIAIHNIFPDAVCVGFSEVDKHAIAVYEHHFPTHENMGSVTDITEKQIKKIIKDNGGIDLIIGGFPCQNLSSMARCFTTTNSHGLEGPKSSLFYIMIQIIKWINKHNPIQIHLLAENNASMSRVNKKLITDTFEGVFEIPVYCTELNGADFGVQRRRRLYWTTWEVSSHGIVCEQTWNDVLEPVDYNLCMNDKQIINSGNKLFPSTKNKSYRIAEKVSTKVWKFIDMNSGEYESNWQRFMCSDTGNNKSSTIRRGRNIDTCVLDRRISKRKNRFLIRYFSVTELERLFWIPEGWVGNLYSKTRCSMLLGNTVIVKVIEYIVSILFEKNSIKKAPTKPR